MDADVVIVGSSLSGLVAGAILQRRGRRVVVLEHADRPGGRIGNVAHGDGWWIDFGQRDGHDVGDCQFAWLAGAEAAREAGVEVPLRRIEHPLRLHRFPEDVVVEGGAWSSDAFLALARDFFECPADGLDELARVVGGFAAAPPAEVAASIPVTLGSWLPGHVHHPGVRRSLRLMATMIFHPRPDEASVGRLMEFFQRSKTGVFVPDHDAVGGVQGVIQPFARAVVERGGEIACGWKPVEIVVCGGRVQGAVAVDRANLVREVEAPVAVCTYPVWEVFDLIDERLFPADVVAGAHALRRHRADLVGWQAGLRRLPTVRATGKPDQHTGWNRLLHGAERSYRGGFHIPSMSSPRTAPPGKHLLSMVMARFFGDGSTAGQPWSDARRMIDDAIAYLHRFYADLAECIEWSSYQYVTAPQTLSWMWAPVKRHPLEVPTIQGLLLASSTLEAPIGAVDIAAHAGLVAARRAEQLLMQWQGPAPPG